MRDHQTLACGCAQIPNSQASIAGYRSQPVLFNFANSQDRLVMSQEACTATPIPVQDMNTFVATSAYYFATRQTRQGPNIAFVSRRPILIFTCRCIDTPIEQIATQNMFYTTRDCFARMPD